ncbi:MAG: 6-phosphofructokinase [Puniceicoccales bacterium]|jgi:6-phosphofructokinase 1|nr:6-phosphofructokinase [Puniceicoccales bacterium]
MAQELTGNLLVAQSGGPSPVINASLAGVITEALQYEDNIAEIYGGLNGIQGILNEQIIDLAAESQQTVRALSQTPGAVLGTCRYKVKKQQDFDRVLDVFAAHDIRYFLYIGGNDSQDTAAKINALAIERGYALRVIGVPKTIDNDLSVTDHCPGYGSVIKYVAATVREIALDNTAMGQHDFVSILEVMGRDTGWIAAGSVLAKRRTALLEDAPHIVLLPEERFNQQAFVDAVQNVLRKQKFCFVVASEGLLDPDGNFLGADATRLDPFGHPVLGGVGEYLRTLVEQNLSGVKARAAKLGIAQRAAAHCASLTDVQEAFLVGKAAVQAAVAGETGKMVVLIREDKDGNRDVYSVQTGLAPLESVANSVKHFPAAWIGEDKMSIGYQFGKYAQPLIEGESTPPYDAGLPKYAQINGERVERKLETYDTSK